MPKCVGPSQFLLADSTTRASLQVTICSNDLGGLLPWSYYTCEVFSSVTSVHWANLVVGKI